jgi:APA family basic amino acid/polyamine antiporter
MAGAATLIIAFCFTRLVLAFPESRGGIYAYPKKVCGNYGEYLSFIAGWSLWGGQGLGPAIVGLSFAHYLLWLLDIFQIPVSGEKGIAIAIILMLGILNCRGIDFSRSIQSITTISIIACLLYFVGAGSFHMDSSNLVPMLPHGIWGLLRASAMASLTYGAWTTIPSAAKEFENVKRDVPLSMICSIITCSVLFAAVIFVQSGLSHYSILATSPAPLAWAAQKITTHAAVLIALAGLFATLSTLNGLMFTSSQLLASMGEDSLPSILQNRHAAYNTPCIAIMCTVIGQIILVLSGLFLVIVEIIVFATTISWIISCITVSVLERKRGSTKKGYVLPVIGLIFCILLCSTLDLRSIFFGLLWIGLGVVIYRGLNWRQVLKKTGAEENR